MAADPESHVIRGTVITPGEIVNRGWVAFADGIVTELGRDGKNQVPVQSTLTDVGDRLIVPGFVDVHVHGGGGGQAAGGDPDEVAAGVSTMAAFHARHGTTSLLATTVSDTPERLLATVTGIRRAMDAGDHSGAIVAGIHLEGPWVSPECRGAHDRATLRPPDPAELEALWDASGGAVRVITLAPELSGADELIELARSHGIMVSVGHTDASFTQTQAAYEQGARHLTHLGNAMPGLDRREPGPIGAALGDDRITLEVIADGLHLHPALLKIVARAAPGRLVAITDAMAATGMPAGRYQLGQLDVLVDNGRAVLADQPETLAGSVLTMDRAVANLVAAGVPRCEAVRAATATPAALLSGAVTAVESMRGVLAPGYRADLVILDDRLQAAGTVIGGRVVYDRDGQLTALEATT